MNVFECVLCSRSYSLEDARKGKYYVQTRVCAACYIKGVAVSVDVWCFGKLFSSKRVECTQLCPDREICKYFITRKRNG
jgi:hypothetical protein